MTYCKVFGISSSPTFWLVYTNAGPYKTVKKSGPEIMGRGKFHSIAKFKYMELRYF